MKKENVPAAVPAKDYLLRRLQDPATAAAYLNAAVEDDDPGAFLQALRNVTDAQGGIGKVASFASRPRPRSSLEAHAAAAARLPVHVHRREQRRHRVRA